ncbi:MAG: DUF5716 family protein [Butyrivibrio sp.]|nr:DUF5716 family protein [Butyrivibrio sp.]
MDTKEKLLCVGIDLCSDYSQVSVCGCKSGEPVSVDFAGAESKYRVPTAVSKMLGKDEWFAGDEAIGSVKLGEAVAVRDILKKAADKNPVRVDDMSVMPIELLAVYFGYLLKTAKAAAGTDEIGAVCVTLEDFNISVLNVAVKAMEKLGIGRDRLVLTSHDESFVYYALSQKKEMWNNDVFLFDYGRGGLSARRLYIGSERGVKIAMTHTDGFAEEIPYELCENTVSTEYLDNRLKGIAEKLFEKKSISTVYLTGEAFKEELKLPGFVKYICDRRRVFIGNNLYCKGACYQAAELAGAGGPDVMLACPQRITTGIEMKISDRGRDKILRMVKPGINWFEAGCEFDFIVDGAQELEIFLSPLDSREKQLVRVPLADFPKRPDKASRITVSFSFTSDSRCHMMVKDRGFGEFYASSGRVINEELLL